MKIVKLHHPNGHAYWQKGEYKIELPNGQFVDLSKYSSHNLYSYEVFVDRDGIWFTDCAASSGTGKIRVDKPILILSSAEYDKIEYVGEPLLIPETLKNDLATSQTS